MTPLMLKIVMGLEDERLLTHIRNLEGFDCLSEGERRTLRFCYERLDVITDPRG